MRAALFLVIACCLLTEVAFSAPQEPPFSPNVPEEMLPGAREGKKQFEAGDYAGAGQTYRELLEKAPDNVYLLSNLGVVLFREGKYELACTQLLKAIQIAPRDGFSHCTLGIIYYSQARYDEAEKSLRKALAIDPKNATAHNYLGITLSQKGFPKAARKELETAVGLDPEYADGCFNLAVVLATSQPPDKVNGRKYYGRALELGSERDTALESLLGWPEAEPRQPVPYVPPELLPPWLPQGDFWTPLEIQSRQIPPLVR